MKQVGLCVPDYLFQPNPIFKNRIVTIRITDQKKVKKNVTTVLLSSSMKQVGVCVPDLLCQPNLIFVTRIVTIKMDEQRKSR
jgi:hypothetical protein